MIFSLYSMFIMWAVGDSELNSFPFIVFGIIETILYVKLIGIFV